MQLGGVSYTIESPFRGVSYAAELTFCGISQQIFGKNQNRPRVPLMGSREAILCKKNNTQKSRDTVPLTYAPHDFEAFLVLHLRVQSTKVHLIRT